MTNSGPTIAVFEPRATSHRCRGAFNGLWSHDVLPPFLKKSFDKGTMIALSVVSKHTKIRPTLVLLFREATRLTRLTSRSAYRIGSPYTGPKRPVGAMGGGMMHIEFLDQLLQIAGKCAQGIGWTGLLLEGLKDVELNGIRDIRIFWRNRAR